MHWHVSGQIIFFICLCNEGLCLSSPVNSRRLSTPRWPLCCEAEWVLLLSSGRGELSEWKHSLMTALTQKIHTGGVQEQRGPLQNPGKFIWPLLPGTPQEEGGRGKERNYSLTKERTCGQSVNLQASLLVWEKVRFSYPSRSQPWSWKTS